MNFFIHIVGDNDSDCEDANCKGPSVEIERKYIPPLPFPGTFQIAEQQKEDYDKVVCALSLIDNSKEAGLSMSNNSEFKEQYKALILCKRWYEKRTGYYGMEKLYPILKFSHNHFTDTISNKDAFENDMQDVVSQKEKNEKRDSYKVLTKRPDPGLFIATCLINGMYLNERILDIGASESIIPLHIYEKIMKRKIEKTDTSIVLANWTTIKPIGTAKDIHVTLEGYYIPTDFLVVNLGNQKGEVILGRPFLSSVGAEFKVRNRIVKFNLKESIENRGKKPEKDPGKGNPVTQGKTPNGLTRVNPNHKVLIKNGIKNFTNKNMIEKFTPKNKSSKNKSGLEETTHIEKPNKPPWKVMCSTPGKAPNV